jgi:tetratricopeptide (TPR) repeat protein
MEINGYQQCPCHPDKKIKFCCGKDVVSGLNEVMSKSQAGQSAGALEQIDRLIARDGEKDCLATLRIKLLMSLGEVEEAIATNERFLQRNPGHFLGLQSRSILCLMQGDVPKSYEALQDAIDSVTGAMIPGSFSKSFETLGAMLLRAGLALSSRQHLQAALRINPENEQAKMLLMETMRVRGPLLLVAGSFELKPAPQGDAPWIKKYENVGRALRRGQFRKAQQILKKALELAPDEPILLDAAAKVATTGIDPAELNRSFRRLAKVESLPIHDRIEAEAIAQLVETSDWNILEEVAVTYPISDLDETSTAALSSPFMVQIDLSNAQSEDGVPPPRFGFWQLDRERLSERTEFTLSTVPQTVGLVELYGRQTDRGARVVWTGVKGDSFDKAQADLARLLPGLDVAAATTEVVGEVTEEEYRRKVSRHLPRGTSRTVMNEIERQATVDFIKNIWPTMPNPHFDLQKPHDLIGKKEYEVPLRASLLLYHLDYDSRPWIAEVLDEVRQSLKLSELPDFEPRGLETSELSPVYALFLNPAKLTTPQLAWCFSMGMMSGLAGLARKTCDELLKRDNLSESNLSKSILLQSAAMLEVDDDRCFELLGEARREAAREQRSLGEILVAEFEQRLLRGRFQGVRRLFEEIQTNHLDNPRVEEQFYRTLMSMGLLSQDGRVRLPIESPEPTTGSKLWTPDGSASSADAVAEPTGGSKLWIPGT